MRITVLATESGEQPQPFTVEIPDSCTDRDLFTIVDACRAQLPRGFWLWSIVRPLPIPDQYKVT